jgi:SAM-dependent methyltransferase
MRPERVSRQNLGHLPPAQLPEGLGPAYNKLPMKSLKSIVELFVEEAVFRLSMRAHRPNNTSDLSHRPATFSLDAYSEWRSSGLQRNFDKFFDRKLLENKRVCDFGCGGGELSLLAADYGASSVIGTDLNERFVREAKQHAKGHHNVEFVLETDDTGISLHDGSVDVMLCFDVVEHIMAYEQVFREWRRVLAPDGRVLIWWSVWWHPYGHHLQTMMPLPWIHALMSDDAMLRVAARIYDRREFRPRFWHFDDQGKRVPNPYRNAPFRNINKLTIRGFENAVTAAGLRIVRRDVIPFSGKLAAIKRLLARSPLRDFFCACVIYELERCSGLE